MHCKTFIAPVRQALDIWAVSATLALGQLVHSICQSHSAFANTFRWHGEAENPRIWIGPAY